MCASRFVHLGLIHYTQFPRIHPTKEQTQSPLETRSSPLVTNTSAMYIPPATQEELKSYWRHIVSVTDYSHRANSLVPRLGGIHSSQTAANFPECGGNSKH